MQSVCEQNNNLTTEILDTYDETFRDKLLNIAKDEIKFHLSNIIKENQEQYELVYSNNVHSGTYYDFKIRIKKCDSLEEKLFRKNLIWGIADKVEGDVPDSRKNKIERLLLDMDDLIGIKILTQVKKDSERIYEILNKNLETLKNNGIRFYDFNKQPKQMKNGMEIYNIKGSYKEEYNFELQIKSQIESAWADMDHEMFYKDYDITPVRKSVQVTMNRVGKLLHEIDGLLYSIRNSKLDFEEEENKIILLRKLNEEYQRPIREMFKVNFPFDFSRYVDFYEYMANHFNCVRDKISNEYVVHPQIPNDQSGNIYVSLHRKNYDTLVNELIFLSFSNMRSQQNSQVFNILEYTELYVNYLLSRFVKNEDYIEGMRDVVYTILSNCPNVEVYVNHNNYKEISEYFAIAYEVMINKDLDMESDRTKELLKQLTLNYAYWSYEQNLELGLESLEVVLDTLGELKQLTSLLSEIESDLCGQDTEKLELLKVVHENFEHQILTQMEGDGFEE